MASKNSHLEKAEGNMSSVTNSYGDKKTKRNQSGITSSDESSESYFSPKDNRKATSLEENPSFPKHQTSKKQKKKKRKTPAVGNESTFGASSLAKTSTSSEKRKLQDDDTVEEDGEHGLTTPEGQMALNPNMTEEQAKAEAKREYNRRNAARARKRNKFMVGGLQDTIHKLTKRTEDLQRSNEVLQAQLEVLQAQNRVLLVSRKDTEPSKVPQVPSSSSNDILLQLLEQLQGKNEPQQQQGQDITQLLNSLGGQGNSSQLRYTLQGGQQVGGNIPSGSQGQGQGNNSQLLSALLGQSQAQQQNSNQTGLQGQNMSQLLSTFGYQGQPQQQRSQQQSLSQPQQKQSLSQPQQQQSLSQQQQQQQQHPSQPVSGTAQDQQQHLQQLLSSMPPEALYNMLRKSS